LAQQVTHCNTNGSAITTATSAMTAPHVTHVALIASPSWPLCQRPTTRERKRLSALKVRPRAPHAPRLQPFLDDRFRQQSAAVYPLDGHRYAVAVDRFAAPLARHDDRATGGVPVRKIARSLMNCGNATLTPVIAISSPRSA
jgi:hypothetical protein